MAKEKQEPYEFLSNLVLALMDMDRIFSNSFFTSELDISPKTLSEIRRGEAFLYMEGYKKMNMTV